MNAVADDDFDLAEITELVDAARETIDLHSYQYYYVAFSGGKDSIALVLYLLDQGVPHERIELHHHLVDGRSESFMD